METFNVSKMATVSNAAIAHLRDVQAIEKLEKDSIILYDLFDLEKIFKVTKRTLFNWRAKGDLPEIKGIFEVSGFRIRNEQADIGNTTHAILTGTELCTIIYSFLRISA